MAARKEHPYHHGDLRRALLREAGAILRTRGVSDLSLRELARRLDVSAAAPYAHFPDKTALLAALAEEGFRTLTQAMRRAFQQTPKDSLRRLMGMVREYVGFAVDHAALFELMFGAERPAIDQHVHLHEAAHDATGVLLAAIIDCQRDGSLAPGDPMQAGLLIWVIIHGIAVLGLADMMPGMTEPARRRADATRLAEAYVQRALHGLAPSVKPRRAAVISRRRKGDS